MAHLVSFRPYMVHVVGKSGEICILWLEKVAKSAFYGWKKSASLHCKTPSVSAIWRIVAALGFL
jgi:hypothetical protein